MTLEEFGVLSTAQDLTDGAVISENVINLGAVANIGFGDLWLSIICETAQGASAGTSSTFDFDLVVSTSAALTTNKSVCKVYIDYTGSVADPRIAAAGRNIAYMEIGQQIAEVVDSTYYFLGLVSTLADGNGTAAVSINAAISPSKPRTRDNVQVTRSNVTIPS